MDNKPQPACQEVIVMTDEVRVRVMHLAAGEYAPWHFHRHLTENIFALSGQVVVEFREATPERALGTGERCEIAVGVVHRVHNPLNAPSGYLLVQAGGRYDFNIAP